jgi:hypothetical protein
VVYAIASSTALISCNPGAGETPGESGTLQRA